MVVVGRKVWEGRGIVCLLFRFFLGQDTTSKVDFAKRYIHTHMIQKDASRVQSQQQAKWDCDTCIGLEPSHTFLIDNSRKKCQGWPWQIQHAWHSQEVFVLTKPSWVPKPFTLTAILIELRYLRWCLHKVSGVEIGGLCEAWILQEIRRNSPKWICEKYCIGTYDYVKFPNDVQMMWKRFDWRNKHLFLILEW